MSKADDALHSLEWGERHFGSLKSGGAVRKRDIDTCVKRGWARSIGPCSPVDGDGFLTSGHEAEGFVITEAGRERLATVAAARANGAEGTPNAE